jgi:hypothetical protein
MYIDSYQVEVQNLKTLEWELDQSFQPIYKWVFVLHRLFGLLRWRKPQIVGNPEAIALIVKADAHCRARHVFIHSRPRNVRLVRVEREGSRLARFIIWLNGRWQE